MDLAFAGRTGHWHFGYRKDTFEVADACSSRQEIIRKSWEEQQKAGLARSVMCETRDLGIQSPWWHTLLFELHVAGDMRVVCPKYVKKMLVKQPGMVCRKMWGVWLPSLRNGAPSRGRSYQSYYGSC